MRASFRLRRGRRSGDSRAAFEAHYADVPAPQRERLWRFRSHTGWREHDDPAGRWRYLVSGPTAPARQVVLILVGGTRSADAAFHLVEPLAEQATVIVPTYPERCSVGALLDGLEALLDREQVQRADLVGMSLGGNFAQLLRARRPERIGDVVLSNCGIGVDEELVSKIEQALKVARLTPAPLLKRATRQRLDVFCQRLPAAERALWQALFHEVIDNETRDGLLSLLRWLIDLAQHPLRPDDVHDNGRVLLVDSDDDRSINAEMRAALQALYPTAQRHTFEGAGHIPALSRGAEFTALLQSFLQAG